MITYSFLGTLESECKWKNLLNLNCQDSIHFGIYQVSYKWRIILKEFLFHFFHKIFKFFQKLQMFVLKTFKFFILYFDVS